MDGSVYVRGYPAGQPAAALARAVAAVCPSDGVSVGRWDARETWRLDARPEATEAEIAAARAVMAAFDPWGAGDDLGALSEGDEEDPGEQPEIFTEEDVEALGAVAAESEAGENPGDGESAVHRADEGAGAASDDGEASASADEMDDASGGGGDVSVSYPGIAIEQLSDEVSIRRAQVIDRITAIEEIRLDGLEDRLAARDEAIRNYNNWPAGVAMDPAVEAAAREWMRLDALASAIRRHASNLRRSARDASADILLSMWGSAINEGWPNDG